MRRLARILLILVLFPPLLAAVAGWLGAPSFLHPVRRPLSPDLVREADAAFRHVHGVREDFHVRAPDGIQLRGWKVRPETPSGAWVLLFHGVADNRVGMTPFAELFLRAGYGVVMMDSRAHGESDGAIATYGWLERHDTQAIVDALVASEHPARLFALGESMGAGIALQSAGVEPRIQAVVAEAPFSTLREASYDYAGLRWSPLLGKTLFAPFSWTLVARGERIAGFPANGVSAIQAVEARPFPVFLICDEKDEALPCRHAAAIYRAATGPKQFWMVPGAFHTAGISYEPEEFRRRVLEFFDANSSAR